MLRSAVLVWKQLLFREVCQVWQEWMLGVCLVSWTKVGSWEFTVDSSTGVRHAGTVHPMKDTWDLNGWSCFVDCVVVSLCTLGRCARIGICELMEVRCGG